VIGVTVQPLISWLWIGGFIVAFGTLLAMLPGRRRRPVMPASAPAHDSGRFPSQPEAATRPVRLPAGTSAVVEATGT
jgi:cytochrome c-type biogenesis protein CcmF